MRFALRRLGFFALTLWAALTLNFFLPRLMPGNPAIAMMGKFRGPVSPQAFKALAVAFGLNTTRACPPSTSPISATWRPVSSAPPCTSIRNRSAGSCLTRSPGRSGWSASPRSWLSCWEPGSGSSAAWRRGGRLDSIAPPVFVITSAIPYFWIGIMLILVFAVQLKWLPGAFGFDITLTPSVSPPFIGNLLQHALLPAVALLVTTIGTWILTMRNTMITTLAEDYVRMARAKGLPGRRIMLDYAARNAILPNLTGFAMSLGFVVGGAILVEYVFNYPGVGFMLLNAVNKRTIPLMQALFLLITVTVLVAILLADIATAIFDPRTRTAD